MNATSVVKKSSSFVSSPLRAMLVGFVLWFFLAIINSGIYFEQWLWKIHLYIRFYYSAWWSVYSQVESVFIFLVFVALVCVVLPVIARDLVRSRTPMRLLLVMLFSTYVLLAFSYGVSQFTLINDTDFASVFKDVAASWFSFGFSVIMFILFPLFLYIIGIHFLKLKSTKQVFIDQKR